MEEFSLISDYHSLYRTGSSRPPWCHTDCNSMMWTGWVVDMLKQWSVEVPVSGQDTGTVPALPAAAFASEVAVAEVSVTVAAFASQVAAAEVSVTVAAFASVPV